MNTHNEAYKALRHNQIKVQRWLHCVKTNSYIYIVIIVHQKYRWTESWNLPPLLDTLICYQTEHKIKKHMSHVVLLAKCPTIKEDFCNFQHCSLVFISHFKELALFYPSLIRGFGLDDLQRFLSTSTILRLTLLLNVSFSAFLLPNSNSNSQVTQYKRLYHGGPQVKLGNSPYF